MLPYIANDSPASDGSMLSMDELLSPLDPHPLKHHQSRQTAGTEFFSVLYLDSPSFPEDERPESESLGGTKPLRVVKKVVVPKVTPVPASCRRGPSISSVPPSPRSPHTRALSDSPQITRSDTSSSTSSSTHPHHTISRLFLASSPSPTSPHPAVPPKDPRRATPVCPPRPRREGNTNLAQSKVSHVRSGPDQSAPHLNLGTFDLYDNSAKPGPSPPMSPAISPVRGESISSTKIRPIRHITDIPPSPLTPTRAPPKACKLLGASFDASPVLPIRRGTKKEHFRPLPSQTLVEIERFFGEVPRNKPSASSSIAKISAPIPLAPGRVERNVGEGRTVRYTGEDGNMWQDVEEEQEFAWLMSEQSSVYPAPVPGARAPLRPLREDREWGMETFTSVLSLPKRSAPKKKGKKPTKDESFFDFGDDDQGGAAESPHNAHKLARHDFTERTLPWSSSSESLNVVTPTKSGMTGRPSSPDSFDFASPRAESPPRLKNRPSPLVLAPPMKNARLPTISTTPGTSHSAQGQRVVTVVKAELPHTPFARPRRAPIPGYREMPAIPAVPALPNMLAAGSLPVPRNTVRYEEEPMEMSFFEPDTPTESKPSHKRVLSGGSVGQPFKAGAKGAGWFKKAVRPRADDVRV